MARIITKQLAENIATKLGAVRKSKKGRAHELCTIFHNNQMVARFGIRHGSEKDKGHDHIPGQIHVGPHDAKLLATCEHTQQWWIQQMQEKGVIPREPQTEE
jgi:hypothetical protein